MAYRFVRFRFLVMVAVSLLGWLCIFNAEPAFSTTVIISGRQILVDGVPFTIKGVGYAPVPICIDPTTTPPYGDYFTSNYSYIYNRDLPLLRQMGANTVRLWGWNNQSDHTDFLDRAYNDGINPIYVIVTFWMEPRYYDICNSSYARDSAKEDFSQMVAAHKNHPAVLMWSIGNEMNASWMYGGCLDILFNLIDEMAQEAHEEEGQNIHPVTTPLVDDIDLINTIATYDPLMAHLDVWSVQVYRGSSFGSLFTDYAAVSERPLAILEYGIDAYACDEGDEYENVGTPYQATYAEALWKEIEANSDVCSGGSIMAYSDEWWKGKYGQSGLDCPDYCPDYDPCYHSTCGYPTDSHPDEFSNEEWWGIMRTRDNGSNPDIPDIMEPRAVYYTLRALWTAYYILHLGIKGDQDIFPQETAAQPYYKGAVSALMAIKYLDADYLQNQDYLYNTYHWGLVGEEMNQAELRDAMNGEAPQEYNFGTLEDNEQDMAVKRFIHWMDYQVTKAAVPNVPALVPTDADYNWKVVRGFVTDVDPCEQDDIFNIPDFQVFGLWLNDPKADGLGFNIYQTVDDFLSTYLPIEGSYLSVAEPPEGIDTGKLDYALRMAKVSFASSKPNNGLFYRLKLDFAPNSFDSSQDFTSARAFNWKKTYDWKEVIPTELKTDSVFMRIFSKTEFSRILKVKELDTNQRYLLVLFSKKTNRIGVSVALMVDPKTGVFRQASWTYKGEEYPRISKKEAIKIAINALKRKYRKPVNVSLVWSRDFNTSRFQPSYEVVFGSLSSISHRKTFKKKMHLTRTSRREVAVYIHQDGSYEIVRSKAGYKLNNREWKK